MKIPPPVIGAFIVGLVGAVIGALWLAGTSVVFPGLGLIVNGSLIGAILGFIVGAPIGLLIGYIVSNKPAKFD